MKKWTIEDSKELYNINGWGTSYFGVNPKGDIYVTPCKDNTQIDLREVMDELALRDVTPPVLLRFPDILDNRIEKTWSCFKKAAENYDYKGEPDAARRRGNHLTRPQVQLGARGRFEARVACRDCRAMPERLHHHLQRLQGRQLHRAGSAGAEDGQTHLHCC